MSGIKIKDIHHPRFQAPDLDEAQKFLEEFGMVLAERTSDRLYMRGTDTAPYLHVTELGEAAFLGLAFEADSAEDLATLAAEEGAPVEDIDAPGGGQRVRLKDPNGFDVDVVHGIAPSGPLDVVLAEPLNTGSLRVREGDVKRVPGGPSQVKRMGHAVLKVADYAMTLKWLQDRFGMIQSDDVVVGPDEVVVASFLRCDRGEDYTDHHTLLTLGTGEPDFDHVAYEVEGLDDLMSGHDVLRDAGRKHVAGIGRHILGSQIYDYWSDPWGRTHEHFTDGDRLDLNHPHGKWGAEIALGTQWGTFGPPA